MASPINIRRALLYAAALVLCASCTAYSLLWMLDNRRLAHPVELGFNLGIATEYDAASRSIRVYNVAPNSPAERAGLQPDDRIIGLNRKPLASYYDFDYIWSNSSPGDSVYLTVRRAGSSNPVELRGVFQATKLTLPTETFARNLAKQITSLFPVLFLVVGFAVLFSRIEDPFAWLLALMFACWISVPSFSNVNFYPRSVEIFANYYRAVFGGMFAASLYTFFALFPQRSWLERRAPYLKWLAWIFAVSQILPGLSIGNTGWPEEWFRFHGRLQPQAVRLMILYAFITLGIVSLVSNSFGSESSPEAKRKARVLLWGTLLGILPAVVDRILADFFKFDLPFWLDKLVVLSVIVYPLSFAYAIVRYRVLEIPALLRRSARYVLVQSGYATLLLCAAVAAIVLFARLFSVYFARHSELAMAVSALFAVAIVWASGPIVKRGTQRIDRAFFRSSYDARVILQDLAEKARTVTSRENLAALLRQQLTEAIHPKSLAFFFRDGDGQLSPVGAGAPELTLGDGAPFMESLRSHGRAWDVPPHGSPQYPSGFPLGALNPECLVPMIGRGDSLVGLLALGESLSEEPYSREDKRMLEAVADQAALALENIQLAEHIADQLAAERRAAHEIEIARDVQSRLFPQVKPVLKTLDYAGACIQARQVGGDYYDYLDLGASRVALLLADISGKGIAGALLMANLQANLRSRYAGEFDDLPTLLTSVNRVFIGSCPEDRFATMFLCAYDDASRTLEYVNCGHNPPFLFRSNGNIEKLSPTASVIGLFPDWSCETRRITLHPGDLLVIYTDGVTEANDTSHNEFTETRLVQTVRSQIGLSPTELLKHIQDVVQGFSAYCLSDDLTMLIARAV